MSVIPVASGARTVRPAVANLSIIGLNVIVFLLELSLGESFVDAWAFTPASLTAFLQGTGSAQALLTIVTSMFMHAGLTHLAGNLLFLWVFGQAVEDAFGSLTYLAYYLTCGVAATLAQYAIDPSSTVPTLGASGAIAGVMGGYLAMFPRSAIDVFVWPVSLVLPPLRVSAWLALGAWFAMQVLLGLAPAQEADGSGGVAYMAHIGGFVIGWLLALLWRPGRDR
jgi:membrane associated rhomboid family serine protease